MLAALAACSAATPAAGPVAFPRAHAAEASASLDGDAAVVELAPAPAAAPPPADEAALREALANAPDPADAALALVAQLTYAERHREALAVLDAAQRRLDSGPLQIARAGVLRDLGQRHAAVRALRDLRDAAGAGALHPRLLFELAELEWLEGELDAAAATLLQLAAVHGEDAWTQAHRTEWQAAAAAIARGEVPRRMRLRDLLGNLRGAPLATERVAVLAQLQGSLPPNASAFRDRAVAIALGDEAGAVRARAVRLAQPGADVAAAFCAEALADPDPLVRQAAADRAAPLLGERAIEPLAAALAAESDPATFAQLHAALAALVPDAPAAVDATDADARAGLLARWRQHLRP
jgi:hypothetical protein